MNPLPNLRMYFLNIHFNIIFQFTQNSSLRTLQAKFTRVFPVSLKRATFPAHLKYIVESEEVFNQAKTNGQWQNAETCTSLLSKGV
jgi:hypothetical protein